MHAERLIGFQLAGAMTSLGVGLAYVLHDKSSSLYATLCDDIVLPIMRLLDPEKAHNHAVKAASLGLAPQDGSIDDTKLAVNLWGLRFGNPIGLAAGFDKHGEAIDGLLGAGFGFVEIGSVTPRPQDGNPKPRMFRLSEDEGVINRYGFNSHGVEVVRERLHRRREAGEEVPRQGLLGVNVGKNKTSEDAAADYVYAIEALGQFADYLVVNISSPNTPGLRSLQRREHIESLIHEVLGARDALDGRRPPVLVKIAPDLTMAEKRDIAEVALSTNIDGLIVSNTTVSRPASLKSAHREEGGGLSGRPLMALATATLFDMYSLTGGKVPLIGAGGVADGKDAYAKIRAGASLVQMYSCLTYRGLSCVPKIKEELLDHLRRDGFSSVQEAVGSAHRNEGSPVTKYK